MIVIVMSLNAMSLVYALSLVNAIWKVKAMWRMNAASSQRIIVSELSLNATLLVNAISCNSLRLANMKKSLKMVLLGVPQRHVLSNRVLLYVVSLEINIQAFPFHLKFVWLFANSLLLLN